MNINPETGEKEYLPSREDSYDRLRDVETQFVDPRMDVEGQVINSIMVEKLHEALRFSPNFWLISKRKSREEAL